MQKTTGRKPRVNQTPLTATTAPAQAEMEAKATINEDPVRAETTGWRQTTIAEFCGLNEVEMKMIDLKISLVQAIRHYRAESKMTRAALAKKLGIATSQIADLESSKPDTSLDALLPAFFAAGGTGIELAEIARQTDESMNY